jgi:hypothetical protein
MNDKFVKIAKTMKNDNRHYRRVDPQGPFEAAANHWDCIIDAVVALKNKGGNPERALLAELDRLANSQEAK